MPNCLSMASPCHASTDDAQPDTPANPAAARLRAIEDLNLKGAAADNPPFTDTLFGVDTSFAAASSNTACSSA